METTLLANDLSETIGPVVALNQDELDAWTILCQGGPLFELGEVSLSKEVWQILPRTVIWYTLELHECGYFGGVGEATWERNLEAIDYGASIVSLWTFENAPDFWVITDRSKSGQANTSISIMQENVS